MCERRHRQKLDMKHVESKRMPNIELLRIIAMLMIMVLHYMNQGKILNHVKPGQGGYYLIWVIEGICYISVNCYMIISGFFGWKSEFRWKRILNLYAEVWFYTILLTIAAVVTGLETVTPGRILELLPVLSRNNWYVTVYFAICILMPILNTAVRTLSRKAIRSVIVVLFILFSVVPTLLFPADPFGIASGSSILWYVFVYLTGAYIGKYGFHIPKYLYLLMGVSVLVIPASKFLVDYCQRRYGILSGYGYFMYRYNSIPAFLASVAFFMMFLKIDNSKIRMAETVNRIGGTTFGIFYIHSFVLIRDHLWVGLGSLRYENPYRLLLWGGMIIIAVFAVCCVIDLSRKQLFLLFDSCLTRAAECLEHLVPLR